MVREAVVNGNGGQRNGGQWKDDQWRGGQQNGDQCGAVVRAKVVSGTVTREAVALRMEVRKTMVWVRRCSWLVSLAFFRGVG